MTLILTFLFTTVLWLGVLIFALRRVILHLKDNPEGCQAISEHVLVPLFGRREEKE
jgi:hypothetical protein